jgi:hypothetical protein
MTAEAIDVVYTWVDGDHPRARALRRRYLQGQADSQAFRHRDNGELRHSLRSLERHAPWVGTIHLVTDGSVPHWLDPDTPNLKLVSHASIFPDRDHLPTFNSHAIELNLHRIPGLSRRFLYFNDDLFLGRASARTDFLADDVGTIRFDGIDLDRDLDPAQPCDRACQRTRRRLAEEAGCALLRRMPAHAPQLYDVEFIRALEARFPAAFTATSARRFRSADDFVLRIAHAAWALQHGWRSRVLDPAGDEYRFLRLRPGLRDRLRDFRDLRRIRPAYFCVNDELTRRPLDRLTACLLRRCLAACFPAPSRFERPAGSR